MFNKRCVQKAIAAAVVTAALSASSHANSLQYGHKETAEEKRIESAMSAFPDVANRHQVRVEKFEQQIAKVRNYTATTQLILRHGNGLWQDAVKSFATANDYDDRPLYWARLQMTKTLRSSKIFQDLLPAQQEKLLWTLELLSRGQQDVKFNKGADYKILLTGFDPFFLDRNLTQSNPSGVSALAFDDIFISIDGKSVEIETLIVPVRFEDFDRGMIETLLTPYFGKNKVDMVFTVSMGRDDFDIERFPALRRSAAAPDNLNILTGANGTNPIIPMLEGKILKGPEFLEFSLPVKAMQKVQSPFKVNDNHKVSTLETKSGVASENTFEAASLNELKSATSVQGSGGGYLSNEISYRSLLLREKYSPVMPVGHIHTPRFRGFEPEKSKKIVRQIKHMITKAAATLN